MRLSFSKRNLISRGMAGFTKKQTCTVAMGMGLEAVGRENSTMKRTSGVVLSMRVMLQRNFLVQLRTISQIAALALSSKLIVQLAVLQLILPTHPIPHYNQPMADKVQPSSPQLTPLKSGQKQDGFPINIMCSPQGIEGFTRVNKLCRKFVLSEQDSEVRNFLVDISPFTDGKTVNVSAILRLLGERGATIPGYEFDFVEQNVSVRPLEEEVLVNVYAFTNHVIGVNRRHLEPERLAEEMKEELQLSGSQKSVEVVDKKQKQGERNIRNAIECVKVWRGIYERSKHKTSLTQAAKLIKISKKSLDDYFLQLRLGELYGFQYTYNLDKKIGVLRAFIRQRTVKDLESHLPKAIKSFDLVRDFDDLQHEYLREETEGQQTLESISKMDSL